MGGEDGQVLRQRQKIESLAKGLQAIFGARAPDIARRQQGKAVDGSDTAEAWRLILEHILASPFTDRICDKERPSSADPHSS